jgi:hypothetical protein
VPLNDIVERLATACRAALASEVEIEFAATFDRRRGLPARVGFLQVRPTLVGGDQVDVAESELRSPQALVASTAVLGNGASDTLRDVVYVKPDDFAPQHTRRIAGEVATLNAELLAADTPYLLIGFGRWGSSDAWLGIPTTWPQLSAARVIVEATLPKMDVEASQGSHFFHNLINFHVHYFTVPHHGPFRIDWRWLAAQPSTAETQHLRHVRLNEPLRIRVDGRTGWGVILHA